MDKLIRPVSQICSTEASLNPLHAGINILDVGGELPLYAAQCKLKGVGKTFSPAEIRGEVENATSFRPKIDYYAILTTGKPSTASQLAIQEINRHHKRQGLFDIDLFAWNRIEELIRRYPDVEQQFFRWHPLPNC